MAKKSSESRSATTVTTETTTSIRDIGLTGADFVDAAAVLQAGTIERSRIDRESLGELINFGRDLSERNAILQGEVLEAAELDRPDLERIAPFVIAAVAIIAPIMLRGRASR